MGGDRTRGVRGRPPAGHGRAPADLLAGGYDFAIRIGGASSPDFVARLLWRGALGLYAARGFAEEVLGGVRVDRAAIERGPCVALHAEVTWRFVDADGGVRELRPGVRFAVNDPRAAVDVARRGLGMVLVPKEAVPLDDPTLVPLETGLGEPAGVDLFVVYPTRRLLPRRVRLAMDWLFATPPPGR
ncbi:MAG: LysR substrate-binding domain-containing protein [Myxococcota bacterium]